MGCFRGPIRRFAITCWSRVTTFPVIIFQLTFKDVYCRGDPDKSDQYGNTALHLAAAKGHLQCVDFLVKFGVNLYSLDIDKHSAKDLAAINNRDDILRYLDGASANLEVTDR